MYVKLLQQIIIYTYNNMYVRIICQDFLNVSNVLLRTDFWTNYKIKPLPIEDLLDH